MTIIIIKHKQMVVDSGGAIGSLVHRVNKSQTLDRHNGKAVAAGYGVAAEASQLLNWSRSPSVVPFPFVKNAAMVVFDGHSIELYERNPTPIRCKAPIALGTGAEVAYGALYAGADIVTAAKAACHYINGCALPLTLYTFVDGDILQEGIG